MQTALATPNRTRQFSVVLAIEFWERFGYYGMQGLLLLFLVQKLGFADGAANLLWGAFAALTYAAPAIGGWLGDQVLGSRRAMVAGATCLGLGYVLLALPATQHWLIYLGMGTISIGNGMFKPNVANLVRRIYEGDDSRLDAAFTLYYMSVNIGSAVSLLLSPVIAAHFGWHAGFGASAIGLAAGLVVFSLLRARLSAIGSAPDFRPLPSRTAVLTILGVVAAILIVMFVLQHPELARFTIWAAGLCTAGVLAWLFGRLAPHERPGLLIACLLIVEVMAYFIFYQQQATSLTLFALRNVEPELSIGGVVLAHLSAGQFQSLNPIWIMIFSPALAWLYGTLGKRGRDPQVSTKFLVGFALVTTAFLVWWLATGSGAPARVSPWVMVLAYGFISAGELLISALSLAMISRYTPQRLSAFMMGALFVAYGVALYIGSAVANLAALPPALRTAPPEQTLPIYHHLFLGLMEFGLVVTLLAALLIPVMRRLERAHARGVQAVA
ncbi:oligopeptide:H+ symporter [Acetobacteraceae bacterium KSS8]|uniref:Oligopeptide:H+ symporter n=1 Tax=Endosaccharibacter trunci TaxID=2812733 RepID=A0ABT1W915_9PROT|nr:oligopeptide:H+ symporter [Acetobacteraceae bacterium KSS8]